MLSSTKDIGTWLGSFVSNVTWIAAGHRAIIQFHFVMFCTALLHTRHTLSLSVWVCIVQTEHHYYHDYNHQLGSTVLVLEIACKQTVCFVSDVRRIPTNCTMPLLVQSSKVGFAWSIACWQIPRRELSKGESQSTRYSDIHIVIVIVVVYPDIPNSRWIQFDEETAVDRTDDLINHRVYSAFDDRTIGRESWLAGRRAGREPREGRLCDPNGLCAHLPKHALVLGMSSSEERSV
ncbi:hypothetical protein KQX54_021059 [Cotesia glomerata]|uniref:Uncharacterized protein n=1 Tax=Cotesia glomerata TaxID=32391 RepID=A0AAV7J673_COTGL|nr:hypothetical protein KQX54_021059 [Cotesia glomerata]